MKRDAKKRFSIEQSPRILVIHLKRFDNKGRKIKDAVQFPPSFSIKNFKSESIDKNVVNKGGEAQRSQHYWKEQYKKRKCEKEGCLEDLEIYSLYAFVVHQGQQSKKGHYYCTVRSPDQTWYQCNDSRIMKLKDGFEKEYTE